VTVDDPVRRRRRWAPAAFVALAVLALATGGIVANRVFAPTEVVAPARADYPDRATATPGPIGRLAAAPLIVDGRLRVYAAERQVRAEAPVDTPKHVSPYWAYRRWPERLVGVVAVGPTVVSRWSDGGLVALDARTGAVAWRADGPAPVDGEYAGRRTGAATVYAPRGLHTATDGGQVVIAAGAWDAAGYDATTGRRLWLVTLAERDGCLGVGFTGGGRFTVYDGCAAPPILRGHDVASGARLPDWRPEGAEHWGFVPVGCELNASGCRGVRTLEEGRTRGWLLDSAGFVAAPLLDDPAGWLVGDKVVAPANGPSSAGEAAAWVARRLTDGRDAWRFDSATDPDPDPDADADADPDPARVLAVEPGAVHLLTSTKDLVTLDAASGREQSRFRCTYGLDRTDWVPGYAYAADRLVAVERLAPPGDPEARDDAYYRFAEPVLLAGT
jgi:hypothetical protein